jgi:hypothetical protein
MRFKFDWDILYSGLSTVLKTGGNLVLLAFLRETGGPELQSIWLLLMIVLGSFVLMDFGHATTLTRVISRNFELGKKSKIEGRKKDLDTLISYFNANYLIIGLATLIFGCFWAFYYLIGTNLSFLNTYIISGLVGFKLMLSVNLLRLQAVLQGVQKIRLQKRIESVFELTRILSLILAYTLSKSLVVILVIDILIALLHSIICSHFRRKAGIVIKMGVRFGDQAMIKNLGTFKYGLMIFGGYVTMHGNSFVIQMFDVATVAAFLLTIRLFGMLKSVSSAVIVARLPKLIMLHSSDRDHFHSLFYVTLRLGLMVHLSGILSVILIAPLVFELIGLELLPFDLVLILGLNSFFEYHHSYHAQIYLLSDKVPFLYTSIITSLLALSMAYYFGIVWGVKGLVMSVLISQLFINHWYPVVKSLNFNKITFTNYLKSLVSYDVK